MQGQPLAWPLAGSLPVAAQVRGQLWRLPSGTVLLSLDPGGSWILGELHARPSATAERLVAELLVGPGIAPSYQQVRARVGPRAELVIAWVASAAELRQAGAHPLRSGNWRRVAPR